MKQDKYFAINNNGSIHEFASLDDALNSSDKRFIVIDRFADIFTPHGGYPWRLSKFVFVNDEHNEFEFTDNGWTIKAIDTTYKSSSTVNFVITICDPKNVLRRIMGELKEYRNHENLNEHDLKIVEIALEMLYEHSRFINWEQVDLENENKLLKEKIQQLQMEISSLKLKL